MKKLIAASLAVLGLWTSQIQAQTVNGAGATFPAPLYSKWAESYNRDTGRQVNYQAIGSSGGIKQIDARTVDFGATDDPIKAEDLKTKGQHQFPVTVKSENDEPDVRASVPDVDGSVIVAVTASVG